MSRSRSILLRRIQRLAGLAVPGTLVETYMRCGTPSCGCHRDPKRRHGPHLYLKYKNPEGRLTSLYVSRRHEREARRAVEAWSELRELLVELGHLNRESLRKQVRRKQHAAKRP